MPDDTEKQEGKLVDIDTSGPGAEIDVPEEKVKEAEPEVEVKDEKATQDVAKSDDAPAKSDEQSDVQKSKPQDEKLEEYSEGVNRRIAKLTKNWREAERQKDAAVQYAQGVEHKRKQWESRYAKLDSTYLKDSETRAKSPRTPAYGGGPPEKTPSLPQVDEQAEEWATKNTWFGKDRAMTFTAFEIHKDLVEKEGFDPKSDEYYAEIDKRIKVDFPHKFGTKDTITSKTPQRVASVRRSVKPGCTNVKLTSSQVAIAKKLGVPLEEYAKQLLIVKEA